MGKTMKRKSHFSATAVVVLVLLLVGLPISTAQAASPAPSLLAYIGPGAGLGFLGSLLAVLMVVLLGLLGLILYPLKLCIRWLRRNRSTSSVAAAFRSNSMVGSERA
jgi:hypothetical protein